MKANLIKTLKNNAELVDIEAGHSARANFPGVNFENAVLIINGKICEPDTIIQDNDIVTLRQIPGDLTETPWWVATFLIPFGFLIQPAELAYKARKDADAAERELEKMKKLTNNPGIENLPFLRGATNAIATGKSQPYLCGRNLLTPYLFTQPYYQISGEDGVDQYVYNMFEGGFKDIVFNKMYLGDIEIININNPTEPQSRTYSLNDKIYAEGIVEVRQDNSDFQLLTKLNEKVVSNVVNTEIPPEYKIEREEAERTIYTLDQCAKSVEICINFPYGLYKYDENNERVEGVSTLVPEYSTDGGETWTYFFWNTGNMSFQRNTTKSIRFTAAHNFGISDYNNLSAHNLNNILVRVRNTTAEDEKLRATCYLYFYQSKIFDPLKSSTPAGVLNDGGVAGLVSCRNIEEKERAYSCIIGLKLKANVNNEKKRTQFNFIATSTARTWNGSAWSETKTATRNPAAIALEILTSDVHPASRYDDSEIDLDAFGALYTYCESNNIKFDYVITQNQKKDATLQLIADVCGCAFYKDIYGRRSVAIDQAQENAVAVYNPQNIISLTNKKTFARRVDALRIKYIESAGDTFKENTYTVARTVNGQPVTIDENSIIKEINATGITTHDQIVKYGRRLMAIDELRPVTTTLKIGVEGVYFTPYAKIAIQDPSINRDAQDAVIKEVVYQFGFLKKIILQNPVTFTDPLKSYGIIINTVTASGAVPLALKVEGEGTTRELVLTDDYTAIATVQPAAGNVASFGELDVNGNFTKITHEFVITRIARTDGGFNLELQEYNEAIYNPGTIPAYKPIVNTTPTPAEGATPTDAVTHKELDEKVAAVDTGAVQAAVDTTTKGIRFTNTYTVRPVEASLEEIIQRMDEDAQDSAAAISILDDEIIIKVEDTERELRSVIDITADEIYQAVEDGDSQTRGYIDTKANEIIAQVEDMEQELTGLIDVQAGAVTALVEGGGASGQMSLSLSLPVMIDATKRAAFVTASTEAKVAAVYALVEGTTYYGIKGNASNAAVKALWDDAVAAGLLASQIVLSADQINIAGKTIYTSSKTNAVSAADAAAAQSAAISAAASDATSKADAAQSAAESTAETNRQALINALSQDATAGHTVIDGGYLKTALIDVDSIFTKNLTLTGGHAYLESGNFQMGVEGFRIVDNGITAFNRVIMSNDVELPVQTNWSTNIKDVSIDMNTETPAAIKTKLDTILSSYGSPCYSTDGIDDKYAYVFIVSTDSTNFYVNAIPALNYKELSAHYLVRYTSGSIQYYAIGSKESSGGFVLERNLLKVQGGTVTKKPNPNNGSDKLLINSVSDTLEVYGELYSRKHIQSRNGYCLQQRGKNGTTTAFATNSEIYDFIKKLTQGVDSGNYVQCWTQRASDNVFGVSLIRPPLDNTALVYYQNTTFTITKGDTATAIIKYFFV